ncbi:MAG: hypothetical protein VKP63_01705 [Cyanobacteriota bacterium]|nr:hypothetical protein [Cyanobacteriota bacterium]
MQSFWKKLVAGPRQEAEQEARLLQGGIELITPSLLTGWAYHPHHVLSDVRLLAGPHLLAQARIDHPRPDVQDHLQTTGCFGFQLEIPADLPLVRIEAAPQVLALSADGSQRFALSLLGSRSSTQQRLRAALEPERRGLRGHFDGLTPDGTKLHGWCYQVGGRTPAKVWLQAAELPPRELVCQQLRPGMASQGHVEACGFSLAIANWPEAAGATVWATFDPEGLLRLPQTSPVQLPPREPLNTMVVVREREPEALLPPELEAPMVHQGVQAEHWQALDGFRRYLDSLERELDRHEQIQRRPPPPPRSLWARLLGPGR